LFKEIQGGDFCWTSCHTCDNVYYASCLEPYARDRADRSDVFWPGFRKNIQKVINK